MPIAYHHRLSNTIAVQQPCTCVNIISNIYIHLKKRHENATEFIILYTHITITIAGILFYNGDDKSSFQIFKTLETEII